MESLAQELLDAIIDHVPFQHARSCSLVARRWRKRGQQRAFRYLVFRSEDDLIRWCRDIPQDPNGIPSYVRTVELREIIYWSDTGVLGRALKCFCRVKILKVFGSIFPCCEVPGIVSSGTFGWELTSLMFNAPYSVVPTLMPLISSFPSLRELMVAHNPSLAKAPVSLAPEHIWKRGPLQSLRLFGLLGEEIEYIARCGITTRKLSMFMADGAIEKIVACSSETVEILVVRDTTHDDLNLLAIDLPPLSALTTLEVTVCPGSLTPRFAHFLSLIHSAPALSSVIFSYLFCTNAGDFPFSHVWADVDNKLAQLAMQVKTKRSVTVVLEGWVEGNTKWEEYLPEFRKTGGQVVIGEILR